ncbi:phosphoenolpyruvate--protein phosphotransferase [Pseudomonas sp. Fl4BN2]|nr:phosphoenolpyruvate--protein phosphotransferase [Pseudomonas sp. Fl4BN2]
MHNNKKLTLSAPLSGPIIKLALVPDEVFSSGVMGDGIAIDPLNDCLYAPCDGVIVHVAKTAHALTLRADNGAEVLLHVGLDTFDLQGEGFQLLVENGEQISNGQPLVRFDPDYIAQRCTSLISLLVLTNGDRFALQLLQHDTAVAGEPLLQIAARQIEAAVTATDSSQGQAQGSVRITHHGGLHARPAALIRQTALGFKSTCRLHIDANSAPCDSIVRLLALGISEHDEVQVSCAGEDADAALQAILAALAKDQVRPAAATLKVLPAVARPINQEGQLNGVSAAPGLASGALYFLSTVQLPPDLGNHLPEEQMQALHSALEQVRAEIRLTLIQARAEGNLDEEAIFDTHLALLEDSELLQASHGAIAQGRNAAHAWSDAIEQQCAILQQLGNTLLAERSNDLHDLQQRVLRALQGESAQCQVPPGAIVAAHELTPSDLLMLSAQQVAGLCMAAGGATSHVAILARGKGLPCLVALGSGLLDLPAGQQVILDADSARLELSPGAERIEQVQNSILARQQRFARQQLHAHEPAVTGDGLQIEIAANVASSHEAAGAHANGADGVGLLRTEFLFVDRSTAPNEQEQIAAYQGVVDAMGDKPVIIRTIDVGGDKQLDYLPLPAEANPVLGLRGIRLAQMHPHILDQQLRALLQVSPVQRCRILLPMITEVDELLHIRRRLEALRGEMGLSQRPELGVMIEVPAAALMAEQLAEHADFLSIGTNDLSQYTLAMDRDHAGLASRVDALHPALLRLIAHTCAGAAKHGRWVGVCGALASDPLATPVLIGLGVRELSVSPLQIGEIKARVRQLDAGMCQTLSQKLLNMSNAKSVREACHQYWPLSD